MLCCIVVFTELYMFAAETIDKINDLALVPPVYYMMSLTLEFGWAFTLGAPWCLCSAGSSNVLA